MQRFSWSEMQRYWEVHADVRAPNAIDDANALANVCFVGAPTWLNAYYAAGQAATFRNLVKAVGPRARARALDVGCGAGRWSRVLDSIGYEVTGVDLQPALIEQNQRRDPNIHYVRCAIQDFAPSERFDLVTSVTVLGHLPPEEQERAVRRIFELLTSSGHALVLENTRDQATHVFSRSKGAWIELFGQYGLHLVAHEQYDYNPTLRFVERVRRSIGKYRSAGEPPERPESLLIPHRASARRRLMLNAAEYVAMQVDRRIDPALQARRARASSRHCGFLFRRSP